ncbi:GNAT family N-acetyltransferase [Nonomuraea typhae]|uniref:GNAT family N-acetyltransferase n=1 Tax=Nonomuraea typhae TaxID=2603600 RepID=UPI0012F98955|nr:GNAT family N-acetyltransferase [Nonomuraea typhae]
MGGTHTADLAEAGRIARAALTYDAGEGEALVRRLAAPPADRRWTAIAEGGGVVFASMSTRDPGLGHIDLLAVHPDEQGKGCGRDLVGAAEQWLRAQGATQARMAGNPPCYAWPGIDVRYTPAAALAERLGYERYHVAWNMTADLTADLSVEKDTVRLAERGVRIAVHRKDAEGPGRAAVVEFTRRHWNDAWAWEAETADGVAYAERDGEILGFAAWGARPGWFGPMGTAPAAQGLGVGRVLLRLALAGQRAEGQTSAQIGWVGPLRFYSRAVGARAERVFWLYRRELV